MIAPGDGEAEPGVFQRACEAGDRRYSEIFVIENPESRLLLHVSSVAHFVGWDECGFLSPGSASPSPGAITRSASFAGWLNGSFQPTIGCVKNPRCVSVSVSITLSKETPANARWYWLHDRRSSLQSFLLPALHVPARIYPLPVAQHEDFREE